MGCKESNKNMLKQKETSDFHGTYLSIKLRYRKKNKTWMFIKRRAHKIW